MITSRAIDSRVSVNPIDDEDTESPNIEVIARVKLFAVCIAELTSIPLDFHAKIPIRSPEITIEMFPKLL